MIKLIISFALFTSYLFSSVSSSALYIDKNENYIYSANLDAGSVSQIDLKTGKLLDEIKLGTEIRRIAFNIDETIFLATDYFENKKYPRNFFLKFLRKFVDLRAQYYLFPLLYSIYTGFWLAFVVVGVNMLVYEITLRIGMKKLAKK